MQLGLPETIAYACEAILAGTASEEGIAARLSSTFGTRHAWMDSVARQAVLAFANRWDDTQALELDALVASAVFPVWKRNAPPEIKRIIRRAPGQKPPPPRLAHIGLPNLPTLRDLADWLYLEDNTLAWLATRWRLDTNDGASRLHHYTYRTCEKRDGRHRLIERPKALLRVAQRKVLHDLLDRVPPHDSAHGFRRGRNIVSFAMPHVDKPLVIRLDLADFFTSITEARVHALFRALGYPVAVARTLTALTTNRVPGPVLRAAVLEGKFDKADQPKFRGRHLPQGAPTSPALANLCAFRLDTRLAALASSLEADYTRYADDLAFSGCARLQRVAARLPIWVAAIALEEGFAVQPRKTRVMPRGIRQRLAGVVVNRHPNLARDRFDTLKATLTNCVRQGPESQNRAACADFRASLAGHVAHAAMLNPSRGAKLKAIFDLIIWNRNEVGRGDSS
jgi:RNA-directed DNA polymerase